MAPMEAGGKKYLPGPSQLRKELDPQSLGQENEGGDILQVVDSDAFVPTTQYDDFPSDYGGEYRPGTGDRNDATLSPNSRKVLSQSQFVKRQGSIDSPRFGVTKPDIQQLSIKSPFETPGLRMTAWNVRSKIIQPVIELPDSQVSNASAPSPTPQELGNTVKESFDQEDVTADKPRQAVTEDRTTPPSYQPPQGLESSHPPNQEPYIGAENVLPILVAEQGDEDAAVGHAQNRKLETHSTSSVTIGPTSSCLPSGVYFKDGRYVRRVRKKIRKVRKTPVEGPKHLSASMPASKQPTTLDPSPKDYAATAIVPESNRATRLQTPEQLQQSQLLENLQLAETQMAVQESPMADVLANRMPKNLRLAFAERHRSQSPASYREEQANSNIHVGSQKNYSYDHCHGDQQPNAFDSILHTVSALGGSPRVGKQHRRSNEPLAGLSVNEATAAYFAHVASDKLVRMQQEQEEMAEKYRIEVRSRDMAWQNQQQTIDILKANNTRYEEDVCKLQKKIVAMNANALTMQKYVKGLGNDYNTLKQQFKTSSQQNSLTLLHEIDKLKNEKTALLEEVSSTIETVHRKQQSMRAVMSDCYVQVRISESNKNALVEKLRKQVDLYEEEKQRRTDLEQRMMPAFQKLMGKMESIDTSLCEKLDGVLSAFDNDTPGKEQKAYLEKCINALQCLQEAPALAAMYLGRMEERIRGMHAGMGEKLTELAASFHHTQPFTEEISREISVLVLKFHDVVAERHRVQHDNETLLKELQARKQSEAELSSRNLQLEQELVGLGEDARGRGPESAELEQELKSVRQKLRESEDNLQYKATELVSSGQFLQGMSEELAKLKSNEEAQKQKIADQFFEITEGRKKAQLDAAELRKVKDQHQDTMKEKDMALNDDIRRLETERDEAKEAFLSQGKELEATKHSLNEAFGQIQHLDMAIKILQEAEKDAAEKLKQIDAAGVERSELLELRQQFKQKDDALQAATRDADTLREELHNMNGNLTCHHEENSRLQAKLVQYEAEIDLLRQKADMISGLEQSLEQSRSKEKKFNGIQEIHLDKINALESQLDDAKKDLMTRDNEIMRIHENYNEQWHKAQEHLNTEIGELKLRFQNNEKEKNEAQAYARRLEAEKEALVEKRTRRSDHGAENDPTQVGPIANQSNSQQQSGLGSSGSSRGSLNLLAGKAHKKSIVRQDNSVLSDLGASLVTNVLEAIPQQTLNHRQGHGNNEVSLQDFFNNPDEEIESRLNDGATGEEIDPSLLKNDTVAYGSQKAMIKTQDLAASTKAESQDLTATKGFNQETHQEIRLSSSASSSDLSDPPSSESDEDLFRNEEMMMSVANARVHPYPELFPLHENTSIKPSVETSSHASHASRVSNDHRQDLLKSRANTGTRIMPPPVLATMSIGKSGHSYGNHGRASHSRAPSLSYTCGGISNNSSPGPVGYDGSIFKTYDQHQSSSPESTFPQSSRTPQGFNHPSRQKRKSPEATINSNASKRNRGISGSAHSPSPGVRAGANVTTRSSSLKSSQATQRASQSSQGFSKTSTTSSVVTASRHSSSRCRNGPSLMDMKELFYQELSTDARRK